jgi:hypothetical protein
MKKLFVVMSCLVVLGGSPVWARVEEPAVVTVRVQELGVHLYITTARGDGVTQTQEFKTAKGQSIAQLTALEYQKLVATYYQQGYVLQGIIPGNQDINIGTSTLLFVKASKS